MKTRRKLLLVILAIILVFVLLTVCVTYIPDLIYTYRFSKYTSSYNTHSDTAHIKTIPNNSLGKAIDSTTYLTDDYFFYKSSKATSVFGIMADYNVLMQYDLHTAKVSPIELDFDYSNPDNLIILGDILYFTVKTDDFDLSSLWEYNIKSNKAKLIARSPNNWNDIYPFICDNSLYYICPVSNIENNSYSEYLFKLNGGVEETVKILNENSNSVDVDYIESDGESTTIYFCNYGNAKTQNKITIDKNGISNIEETTKSNIKLKPTYRKFGDWSVKKTQIKVRSVTGIDWKEHIFRYSISNGDSSYNLAKSGEYEFISWG